MTNMTPEQLLKDAENELQKARAADGKLSQAVQYILDALGLMLNAQNQMLEWMRSYENKSNR